MSNDMQNLMEEIEKSLVRLHRGDVVTGKVINITDNEIIVNVGYKSDGVIPRGEISNDTTVNPHDVVKIGDEIKVYVIKVDDGEGNVLLSKKRVDAQQGWEELEKAKESGTLVETKVVEAVQGGVIAIAKGIRCFIPASQLSDSYVEDLKSFVGEKFNTKVIEINQKRNKVILSRKLVVVEEKKERKAKVLASLEKGQRVKGEVKNITNFGAFVDIGGIDGLIHISDLSWGRVKHPSEVVEVGDTVEVEILDLDKDNEKISLGLKQTQSQPWDDVMEKYNVGDIVEGKVVKLMDYGAFVELEAGLDGLVHISEISKKFIKKPSEELQIGQIIKAKILDINTEDRRISLSIAATEESEEEAENVEYINDDSNVTIGDVINTSNDEENKES